MYETVSVLIINKINELRTIVNDLILFTII